jgi:hypothetical protein
MPPKRKRVRSDAATSTSTKLYTGNIGTVLRDVFPFIADDDMIGKPLRTSVSNNLQTVVGFLRNHQLQESAAAANAATAALAPTSISGTLTNDTNDNNEATAVVTSAEYYEPTLKQFCEQQFERQAAGLRTNTNRTEKVEDLNRLIENHKTALTIALENPSTSPNNRSVAAAAAAGGSVSANSSNNDNTFFGLSKDRICKIHGAMRIENTTAAASDTKNLSSTNISSYRTTMVRASTTHFCAPNRIEDEMQLVLQWMETYAKTRWNGVAAAAAAAAATATRSTTTRNIDDSNKVYNAVAMSAIWIYVICDVHPFRDGNGRLSRILCNYVLKQLLKLPFAITLAATPQQRKELIGSLQYGRMRISRLSSLSSTATGTATATAHPLNSVATAFAATDPGIPIFQPLVDMLLDRLSNAIHQFQALLGSKSRAAEAKKEAAIIRSYRVQAALGQCIICLDDKPNIATLCCGQAVHLNCIAEWLSNQQSCVSCRSPLPRLMSRQPTTINSRGGEGEDATTEDTTDTTEYAAHLQQLLDAGENSDSDDTTGDTTSNAEQPVDGTTEVVLDDSDSDSDDTTGDTTSSVQQSVDHTTEIASASESADDTTVDDTTSVVEPQPKCQLCNNLRAFNCVNELCGRCCIDRGGNFCHRHQTLVQQPGTTEDGTSEDDTTDSTTDDCSSVQEVQQGPLRCLVCNNLSSLNCENRCCGRCCVSYGADYCNRHQASL